MTRSNKLLVLLAVLAVAIVSLVIVPGASAVNPNGWSYGAKGTCYTRVYKTVYEYVRVDGKLVRKIVRKLVTVPGYKEYYNGRPNGRCILQ